MKIETEIFCTLKMTEKETLWLMSVMRNPIHEPEDPLSEVMRRAFWDTLVSKIAPR